jgi:hypothetical protein
MLFHLFSFSTDNVLKLFILRTTSEQRMTYITQWHAMWVNRVIMTSLHLRYIQFSIELGLCADHSGRTV